MSDEKEDDGVNREGLDYRAGYVEALSALLRSMQVNAVRCKKGETAGLQLAHGLAVQLHAAMLKKMRGE